MSAAEPPPPPPPPPSKSNQPLHYTDMPSEPERDSRDKRYPPTPTRRWYKHLKPPRSPEIATPPNEQLPTRRSFIWPWLEGKLEKKPSSSSGEGSSSSPRVSDSGPPLAPLPMCAVMGPQTESIALGSSSNEMLFIPTVYDPISGGWRSMDIDEYTALFGVPSTVPAPEANLTKLESNCIDVLRSGFSLDEETQSKEEENVVQAENKEEKLPEDEVKEEEYAKEKKEKELQVYSRRSKMKPKTKAVQIGEIEVQVPLKRSEKAKLNPTGSSSSANVGDVIVKEKMVEPPEVEEDKQGGGTGDQKTGKKKKNKGKKKIV